MNWGQEIAYFFGGAFLANALPHYISGLMGRALQSPFAKPPGQGYSSSLVNTLWGFFNLIIAYALLLRVGDFDIHNNAHVGAAGLGMLLIALHLSRHFGKFNGGNEGKFS
jgi:membrane associated rhomboid family serine protease